MRKLAKLYGISDVALAKACRRAGIPAPPRGYWAKIQSGKRVKRPALPPATSGAPPSIVFSPSPTNHPVNPKVVVRDDTVQVPENLRNCHPLVTSTRHALERAPARQDQYLSTTTESIFEISVSKQALHRALCLVEALIRACERKGWSIDTGKNKNTKVVIGNDPVSVRLSEKITRKEIPPSPHQKSSFYFRRYEYIPTGLLAFQIVDYIGDRGRTKWSDGKVQRLEDLLPEIVPALHDASERLRIRRLTREEQERQWEEQRQRRKELAERVRIERTRRIRLDEVAAGFQRAQLIRSFCDELQQRSQREPDRFSPTAVENWTRWASAVAQTHDPFENGYIQEALTLKGLDGLLDCSKEISVW